MSNYRLCKTDRNKRTFITPDLLGAGMTDGHKTIKHSGMKSCGTLGKSRRMLPAGIPSPTNDNAGQDVSVSIVPVDRPGWGSINSSVSNNEICKDSNEISLNFDNKMCSQEHTSKPLSTISTSLNNGPKSTQKRMLNGDIFNFLAFFQTYTNSEQQKKSSETEGAWRDTEVKRQQHIPGTGGASEIVGTTGGWAAAVNEDVDYNEKICFSDEEDVSTQLKTEEKTELLQQVQESINESWRSRPPTNAPQTETFKIQPAPIFPAQVPPSSVLESWSIVAPQAVLFGGPPSPALNAGPWPSVNPLLNQAQVVNPILTHLPSNQVQLIEDDSVLNAAQRNARQKERDTAIQKAHEDRKRAEGVQPYQTLLTTLLSTEPNTSDLEVDAIWKKFKETVGAGIQVEKHRFEEFCNSLKQMAQPQQAEPKKLQQHGRQNTDKSSHQANEQNRSSNEPTNTENLDNPNYRYKNSFNAKKSSINSFQRTSNSHSTSTTNAKDVPSLMDLETQPSEHLQNYWDRELDGRLSNPRGGITGGRNRGGAVRGIFSYGPRYHSHKSRFRGDESSYYGPTGRTNEDDNWRQTQNQGEIVTENQKSDRYQKPQRSAKNFQTHQKTSESVETVTESKKSTVQELEATSTGQQTSKPKSGPITGNKTTGSGRIFSAATAAATASCSTPVPQVTLDQTESSATISELVNLNRLRSGNKNYERSARRRSSNEGLEHKILEETSEISRSLNKSQHNRGGRAQTRIGGRYHNVKGRDRDGEGGTGSNTFRGANRSSNAGASRGRPVNAGICHFMHSNTQQKQAGLLSEQACEIAGQLTSLSIVSPPSSATSTLARSSNRNGGSQREEEADEWETATEGSVGGTHQKKSDQRALNTTTNLQSNSQHRNDRRQKFHSTRGRGKYSNWDYHDKRHQEEKSISNHQQDYHDNSGSSRGRFRTIHARGGRNKGAVCGTRRGRHFSNQDPGKSSENSNKPRDSDGNRTLTSNSVQTRDSNSTIVQGNTQDFHFDDGASSVSGGPEFVEVPSKKLQKQRRLMLKQQQEQEAKRAAAFTNNKHSKANGRTHGSKSASKTPVKNKNINDLKKSASLESATPTDSSKSTPSHSSSQQTSTQIDSLVSHGDAWSDAAKTRSVLFGHQLREKANSQPPIDSTETTSANTKVRNEKDPIVDKSISRKPTQERKSHFDRESKSHDHSKPNSTTVGINSKKAATPPKQKQDTRIKETQLDKSAVQQDKTAKTDSSILPKQVTAAVAPMTANVSSSAPQTSPNNVCKVRPQQQLSGNQSSGNNENSAHAFVTRASNKIPDSSSDLFEPDSKSMINVFPNKHSSLILNSTQDSSQITVTSISPQGSAPQTKMNVINHQKLMSVVNPVEQVEFHSDDVNLSIPSSNSAAMTRSNTQMSQKMHIHGNMYGAQGNSSFFDNTIFSNTTQGHPNSMMHNPHQMYTNQATAPYMDSMSGGNKFGLSNPSNSSMDYLNAHNATVALFGNSSTQPGGSRPGSSFSLPGPPITTATQRLAYERHGPMVWNESASQQQTPWPPGGPNIQIHPSHPQSLMPSRHQMPQHDMKGPQINQGYSFQGQPTHHHPAANSNPHFNKFLPPGAPAQGRQNDYYSLSRGGNGNSFGPQSATPTHIPPPSIAPQQSGPYVATPPATPYCFAQNTPAHTGAPAHHQLRGPHTASLEHQMREQRLINTHPNSGNFSQGQHFSTQTFLHSGATGIPQHLAQAAAMPGPGHTATSGWKHY